MNRFAVFGSPISHSLSPQIHAAFAAQFGIALTYERIPTEQGGLKNALAAFQKIDGKGANITLPLKHEAFTLCQRLSLSAQRAKAANTIGWNEQGELWGDNTDGEGLIHDLTHNHQLALTNKRILLLGAGGAASCVLSPLLAFSPTLVVVNRDITRARSMLTANPALKAMDYELLAKSDEAPFDLIINATSASLQESVPPLDVRYFKEAICIDLVYQQKELTPFLQWAKAHEASGLIDGLGMLIEQAALGFALWHSQVPNTQSVISQLR